MAIVTLTIFTFPGKFPAAMLWSCVIHCQIGQWEIHTIQWHAPLWDVCLPRITGSIWVVPITTNCLKALSFTDMIQLITYYIMKPGLPHKHTGEISDHIWLSWSVVIAFTSWDEETVPRVDNCRNSVDSQQYFPTDHIQYLQVGVGKKEWSI